MVSMVCCFMAMSTERYPWSLVMMTSSYGEISATGALIWWKMTFPRSENFSACSSRRLYLSSRSSLSFSLDSLSRYFLRMRVKS